MIHPSLQQQMPMLTAIFKKNGVKRAYLFGSAVTDRFSSQSDIDFLIEPLEDADPVRAGGKLWDLYFDLEDLLQRKIDLVTRESVTNPYFIKELDRTAVEIYG